MTNRLILSLTLLLASASAHAANSGWSVHIDNDLFLGGERDQDYTGGISLTISGEHVQDYHWSGIDIREFLDKHLGFNALVADKVAFSVQAADAGFALFTPSDITIEQVQPGERPYGSLFFVGSTTQTIVPETRMSYQSTLLIGALGLPLAEFVQSSIHDATGSNTPKGWDNQISAGGELTARYSLGVRKGLAQKVFASGLALEINTTSEANIGFTTDINAGVNFRFGRLSSPWWTFAPHQAEYVNLGNPSVTIEGSERRREIYVYAGATFKYRVYNAMLQGQFRDSRLSFDHDQIIPELLEVWAGISYELPSGIRVGVFGRALTEELDIPGFGAPRWAGLTFSQGF